MAAGWAMTRGRRVYNEDNVFCEFRNVSKESSSEEEDVTEMEVGCIGVFDGHGGAAASEYVKGNLFENILGSEKFPNDVFKALGMWFKLLLTDFACGVVEFTSQTLWLA